jgi:uncharacterized protein (DUF2236 family)
MAGMASVLGGAVTSATSVMGRLPVIGELRRQVVAPVRNTLAIDRMSGEQYTDPPGDPGLFGPGSVTWRVHAHPSMLIAGLAALIQQTTHPLAMAGVSDHSNYRDDPLGRLGRTASFVTATTYGSTEVAEQMIEAVKAVHTRVKGTAPDGRPYDASDPELIVWVHMTEVVNFLRAHQRFVPLPVWGEAADRYFHEMAVIPERLGATGVPRSRSEARAYFRRIRAELSVGDQARDTIEFLTTPTMATINPLLGLGHRLIIEAAIGLLPGWTREMTGLQRSPAVLDRALDWTVLRPATFAMLSALQFAGGEAPELSDARRRCAQEPLGV